MTRPLLRQSLGGLAVFCHHSVLSCRHIHHIFHFSSFFNHGHKRSSHQIHWATSTREHEPKASTRPRISRRRDHWRKKSNNLVSCVFKLLMALLFLTKTGRKSLSTSTYSGGITVRFARCEAVAELAVIFLIRYVILLIRLSIPILWVVLLLMIVYFTFHWRFSHIQLLRGYVTFTLQFT